jgi:hypothetical protein
VRPEQYVEVMKTMTEFVKTAPDFRERFDMLSVE